MKNTVAVCMIVAAGDDREAKQLQRALGSINGYVDAIYVQLNAPKGKKINPEVERIAKRFTDNVSQYTWTGNFVGARTAVHNEVSKIYDWIMFLDSDDRVENPEMIKQTLAVMPEDVQGLRILYDYQKDEHGNVIVALWNERVVRNNGSFGWKSSIDDDEVSVHETLIAKRQVRSVANNEWKVVHEAEPGHYKESLERNITLLEGMYRRQAVKPEGVDPRILFYLGSHYNEALMTNKALELFIEYLKHSGWAEERAEAHIYIGRIIKNRENFAQARTAFLLALGENPNNPGAYLELGKIEAKAERWEQAAAWLKRGIDIKVPITAMVQFNYDYELYTLYAEVLSNLGGKSLSLALKMAQKALELRPFDPQAVENRDVVQKLINYRDNLRGVNHLLGELIQEDDKRVIPFLDALPTSVKDSGLVVKARQKFTKPTTWGKRSIVIYVGMGPLGIWGPWSLNEGGIGGSEEAVIRLSRELTEMGWGVTVYGMPGERGGVHDKVDWKQYWEFNPEDDFNILISWRQPAFFDTKFKAKKTYLWLHDVMPQDELVDERLENITKIIYVSKYHAERPESEHIPKEKKLISGNGITPDDFQKNDTGLKRDPTRCIYMSANERGLRILYDIWEDVRKAVPNATLDIYYGWHSFDSVNRDNPERMAWKASMVMKAKKLPGVTERGRVGQDELNKEIFKSGVFAYPSFFPEVNCITAQKAMAGGATPVTSDFAVLKDVIPQEFQVPMHDFKPVDIERYKAALIHRLLNPQSAKERAMMMKNARDKFDWKVTAGEWDHEFKR